MVFKGDGNPLVPIFFLSYAQARLSRTSQTSPRDAELHVLRLFDDLSSYVGELLGSAVGEYPGFMDRSMEGETRWAPEVLAAAGTCHVFIPLISSGYVKSKWCAMEWDAFWRRNVIRRPSDSSGSQTAILAVIWLPMLEDRMPPGGAGTAILPAAAIEGPGHRSALPLRRGVRAPRAERRGGLLGLILALGPSARGCLLRVPCRAEDPYRHSATARVLPG